MNEVYSIHYLGDWWVKPWAVFKKVCYKYQSPTYQRVGQYVLLNEMV